MAEDYKTRCRGDKNPNYKGEIKICKTCGKEYQNYNKSSKYCSQSCAGNSEYNLNKLRNMSKRKSKIYTCISCGIEIKYSRKYCDVCLKNLRSSKRGHRISPNICIICEKEFYNYNKNAKTCSILCRNKYRSIQQRGEKSHRWQGGKTEATRKIRNRKEYKEWRTSVYERDNFTCNLCGQKGLRLTAHHIIRMSIDIDKSLLLDNGITLCWGCHGYITASNKDLEMVDFFNTIIRLKI